MWRMLNTYGEERSQVKGSDSMWRGAIRGGEELLQMEGGVGAIADRAKRSQVVGSDCRWWGAISGGASEGRNLRQSAVIAGEGERAQVEGSNQRLGSDQR